MKNYRGLSLWHDTSGEEFTPRRQLDGDIEVDVAIVGAGFTGLWSAYHLLKFDPSLTIAIIESQIAGFGASGRNGGWASAIYPVSNSRLTNESGPTSAQAIRSALVESIDGIEQFCTDHDVDADFVRGGRITVARTKVQMRRLTKEVSDDARYGTESELLGRADVLSRIDIEGAIGGSFDPSCARVHPTKLVRGLARVVENAGAVIYERTHAKLIEPHLVVTDRGRVQAKFVIRATEAFTPAINRGSAKRELAPVYSLMVATEPLPAWIWDRIGLRAYETFSEARHLIVYGQRTADDRLAVGGRGAPYFFGSKIRPSQDRDPKVHEALRNLVRDWFPEVKNHLFTHAWGGPLGISRDWHPQVNLDRNTGLASAGGYVGDGVTTTYLAGATLASLIMEKENHFTRLPLVGHKSRLWEPEPIRWLAVNAGLLAMSVADREESLTRHSSYIAKAMAPLLGH
ncbi:MAG TPA: FAD-dependent oxidoreductase [Candidatus Nanopelagicaceae bacterium]|nr:FAD-dependent oxidoreductase [Candidatus Nanopelagicaceae bacterium]